MAYFPRPDGLNDLFLDDGTRLMSPLPAMQLEAMGHQLQQPGGIPMPQGPGLDPNAVAGPGGGMLELPPEAYGPGQRMPAMGGQQPGGHSQMAPASAFAELPAQAGASPAEQQQRAAIQKAQGAPAAPRRNLVPLGQGMPQQQGVPVAGGGPRITKIKGGDVRASFARVPGQEVPDDVKADAINEAPEDMEIGAEDIVNQREQLRMKREEQLAEQRQMIDRQQVERQRVDQRIQGKQSLIDQRDRETEKLTPQSAKEVFDDKSVFARLSAALSMIAGGAMQGLQGGANPGYQMVRDSIMDEVASQRAAYEDAKERGETARNDFASAVAMYGTPEAAAMDLEMRRLGVAEKMLLNRASKVEDSEYLMATNQAAEQLRAQRAQVKMQLLELERGKVVQENWQYQPDRYIASGGAPNIKKEDGERMVRLPNGQVMYARDSTRSRSLQEAVKANARLGSLAGRLKSLTDTVGKREPTAGERAAADTIKSEMMFTYKDASQAGALDKGLQDAMEGYFGKATDVFRVEDVPRKLDEVKRIADGKVAEVIRYDLHPDANFSPGVLMPPPGESDE